MIRKLQALFITLLLLSILGTVTVYAETGDASGDWKTDRWEEIYEEELEGEDDLPPDEPTIFPDVPPTAWFYEDVMALYEANVIDGFTDGKFYPDDKVTTGQALKMILLAAGYDEPERVASHWARGYLDLALAENVLVRGEITDLDVSISRLLVARVAARALSLTRQADTAYFVDTNDDAVQALYETGIITGYTDGTFLPERTLSRAELSAIVHRIYIYRERVPDSDNSGSSGTNSDISLRTTETCIQMLKDLEGFQEKPYWDYQQYSIGYGSACKAGDYPNGITRDEADRLLRTYIQGFEKDLNTFLETNGITLTDSQYDALICFTYNLGSSWMHGTKLSRLLISGNYSENEFATAYGVWCHVGTDAQIHTGLIARRVRELRMFFDNVYTNPAEDTFYYVIFKSDKGEVDTDVALFRAGTNYESLPSAQAAGDTFVGWYTEDGSELTAGDTARQNLTVHAVWASSGITGSSGDDDAWYEEGWYDESWYDASDWNGLWD